MASECEDNSGFRMRGQKYITPKRLPAVCSISEVNTRSLDSTITCTMTLACSWVQSRPEKMYLVQFVNSINLDQHEKWPCLFTNDIHCPWEHSAKVLAHANDRWTSSKTFYCSDRTAKCLNGDIGLLSVNLTKNFVLRLSLSLSLFLSESVCRVYVPVVFVYCQLL